MVRALTPSDLMVLRDQGDLQPEQIAFTPQITWDYACQLCNRGGGMIGAASGSIVVAAGVIEKWPGTGYAWALFTSKAGPHMKEIARHTRKYLHDSAFPRIELLVKASFRNGHRYARLLGFSLEAAEMRRWSPDGGDFALYSMVR